MYELMKFAVIKTGGKQYKVSEGDTVKIERIKAGKKEPKEGDKLTFNEVLMVSDNKTYNIGTPTVKGATVEGELKDLGKDKKVTVIKYKAKSRYFRKKGHRQPYFKVKINKIS